MRRTLLVLSLLALTRCNCSDAQKKQDPCAGIDLSTSLNNCGACGHACAAGLTCSAGACVDPCAGKDLQTDAQNCGTCGHACAANLVCTAGSCVDPCAGKDLQTDPQNCGTCGHACGSAQTCAGGTCALPAFAIAITAPAEGAHLSPSVQVSVGVTATGPVDSVTVTATPGSSGDASSGAVTLDLGSLPDHSAVTLTAHAAQGTRTADSAPVHIVVDKPVAITPVFVGVSGYYLINEKVSLQVSISQGTATQVQFMVGAKLVATASAPPFKAIVDASALGTGDVTVTAVASDGAGHSGSATAALTVGLLHGSGTPARPLTDALAVQQGSGKGVLWAAHRVDTIGELRWTGTNGGQEIKLADTACFTGSGGFALDTLTGLMPADASAIAFPAANAGGDPATCTHLLTRSFPRPGPRPSSPKATSPTASRSRSTAR